MAVELDYIRSFSFFFWRGHMPGRQTDHPQPTSIEGIPRDLRDKDHHSTAGIAEIPRNIPPPVFPDWGIPTVIFLVFPILTRGHRKNPTTSSAPSTASTFSF